MAPAQEETPEHFWQRQIKKLSVQHRFHFRVATPHRIADHHHVRIRRDVFIGIALHQSNSFLLKEAGHRGVNIFVRPGDFKAAFLQRDSNRAHRCPANSEEVKTLGRVLHGSNFYDAPAALASDDLSFRAERSGVEEPRWFTLGPPRFPRLRSGGLWLRANHFFWKTSIASHASSGGTCSYSSARCRYILASKSSG